MLVNIVFGADSCVSFFLSSEFLFFPLFVHTFQGPCNIIVKASMLKARLGDYWRLDNTLFLLWMKSWTHEKKNAASLDSAQVHLVHQTRS